MFDASAVEKTSYYMPVTTWEEAKKYSECGLLYVVDVFRTIAGNGHDTSWLPDGGWVARHGAGSFFGDIHYGYKFAVLVEDE